MQPDAFAQVMENKLNLIIPKINRRRSSFNAEETVAQHCSTNVDADFENMPKLRESRANSWSVADNKVESESLSNLSSLLMTCSFYDSHSTQSSPECTTSIDTTNFKRATSSDSLFSISSTADLNSAEQECGIIEIRPAYDRITNVLSVNIIQAFDIRNVPPNCSIFLVIFLLPYPKPLFKTKAHTRAYIQLCKGDYLRRVALLCQMYARLGAGDQPPAVHFVGETKVRLKDLNLQVSKAHWLSLLPHSENVDNDAEQQYSCGELQFALSYSPTVQRLTVILLKVRNVHNSEGRIPNGKRLFSIIHNCSGDFYFHSSNINTCLSCFWTKSSSEKDFDSKNCRRRGRIQRIHHIHRWTNSVEQSLPQSKRSRSAQYDRIFHNWTRHSWCKTKWKRARTLAEDDRQFEKSLHHVAPADDETTLNHYFKASTIEQWL
ncbi:hypothetical protein D917_07544 [Trichinella nativa]|uniref:Uncharacterized protein n=1 Tax=Trichinella nativa TaxID=6335 RepID=A0A1Y3ENF6_9BILA|nr:hypothetical protein D917_07544 [Trichinella nativa]